MPYALFVALYTLEVAGIALLERQYDVAVVAVITSVASSSIAWWLYREWEREDAS